MSTNLPSCFSIEFSEQLLKFLVNFTLLKYVKSQRSYGFLITKERIFGFQILDLKDHFSASLTVDILRRNIVFTIAPYEGLYNNPKSSDKIWAQDGGLFLQKIVIFLCFSSVISRKVFFTNRTDFIY